MNAIQLSAPACRQSECDCICYVVEVVHRLRCRGQIGRPPLKRTARRDLKRAMLASYRSALWWSRRAEESEGEA